METVIKEEGYLYIYGCSSKYVWRPERAIPAYRSGRRSKSSLVPRGVYPERSLGRLFASIPGRVCSMLKDFCFITIVF
jgi:hypothetical protein